MHELSPVGAPLVGNKRHVLVCTNDRESGSCCSKVGGYDLFRSLKESVKGHDLADKIWVTRTGCLGFCNDVGATVVMYPERRWFCRVTKKDVPHLLDLILREQ